MILTVLLLIKQRLLEKAVQQLLAWKLVKYLLLLQMQQAVANYMMWKSKQ